LRYLEICIVCQRVIAGSILKEGEMKRYFLLLSLLLFPGVGLAADIGLNDVVEALQQPFKAGAGTGSGAVIADFQADFDQQSRIAAIERTQHGNGTVRFRFDYGQDEDRPRAMFRWDYLAPTRQEVISNAETLWVYLPENRQVIVSDIARVTQQRTDNPMTFLGGLGNLGRDFSLGWASPRQDQQGNWRLELKPKKASGLIQQVQILVDHRAVSDYLEQHRVGKYFPIRATTVIDPNNNSTTIEFLNVKFNLGIATSYFQFNPPIGVEVVHPTGSELGL
jgi:outer membrane lipoprotein carrier protein